MTTVENRALTIQQQFSNQEIELMRRTVAKGASPDQFALFLEMCRYYRLNPLMRQIYCIIDKSGRLIIQTSIDGFRLMAERTGKYAGQLGPFWCGTDGAWCDVWLKSEPPAAAKVGILRGDFLEPIWSAARYSSYARNTDIWTKMPDLMLAKVAESLAFRRAFPAEMSGIYTHEEMAQAGIEAVTVEQEPTLSHLIGQTKKRAKALDVARNADEWAQLLSGLGIDEITSDEDIAAIHDYLSQCEQLQHA